MMKKRAKRLFGALALALGTVSATLWLGRRRTMQNKSSGGHKGRGENPGDKWARPGMSVTFRAELMPGRSRAERTFKVAQLLPSRRVILQSFAGEHTVTEFEPLS